MSTMSRPRGPLPSRVYWTRRALVLVVALVLVMAVVRLLGGGGGSGGSGDSAQVVGSSPRPSTLPGADASSASPTASAAAKPRKKKPQPLATPDGPCDPSDVVVTPRVPDAYVGDGIRIVLRLTTLTAAACTWEVSPQSVVLAIVRHGDDVWSSQDCPQAIPTVAVVPRRTHADKVVVVWDGRQSDPECSDATDWAFPKTYRAEAVATGSVNPVETRFELRRREAATITAEPSPTASPSGTPTSPSGTPTGRSTGR